MREITNTNWDCERELNLNEDEDLTITEEGWYVSFDYNGNYLKAVINFNVDFYTFVEDGDRDTPEYRVTDVNTVEVELKELYDNEDEDFIISAKELIHIENQLEIDLKIQF